MEKQGMGRGLRLFRIGLLVFFLIFPGVRSFSQDLQSEEHTEDTREEITIVEESVEVIEEDTVVEVIEEEADEVLEIHIESSPANPQINSPWTYVIMVNHPNPSFVNIRPPEIPASLQMDNRVRVEARIFRGERWTRFEYTFISRTPGTFTLDPFLITVPGLEAETERISVSFRDIPVVVRRYDPRFFWLGLESSFYTGQRGELHLELRDWNPELDLPHGIFHGRAPVNAILTESPPLESGNNIYRYTLVIIPLDEEQVSLESFSFRVDAHNLTVPALRIPVLASFQQDQSLTEDDTLYFSDDTALESETEDVYFFPDSERSVFFPLQSVYDSIVDNIAFLWNEGRRGEALAEIRRNERDSFSGIYLAPLRLEMEQVLGLGFTEDENWRPLRIHPISWIFSIFLIIFTGIFLLIYRPRKQKKSIIKNYALVMNTNKKNHSSTKGLKLVFIYFLIIGFSFIFFEEGVRQFLLNPLDSTNSGIVIERTSVHRIPDFNSGVNAFFNEGQPLSIGELRGEWHYAESNDGRSGWIHHSTVIIY